MKKCVLLESSEDEPEPRHVGSEQPGIGTTAIRQVSSVGLMSGLGLNSDEPGLTDPVEVRRDQQDTAHERTQRIV